MGCAVQKGLTDVHKMFLVCCIFCRLDSARSSGVNRVVSNALRRPGDELDHRSDRKSSACGPGLTEIDSVSIVQKSILDYRHLFYNTEIDSVVHKPIL